MIFHGKLLNIQMVSSFIILLIPWKSKGRPINEGVEKMLYTSDVWMFEWYIWISMWKGPKCQPRLKPPKLIPKNQSWLHLTQWI